MTTPPTKEEVIAARLAAGMTQEEAGALVGRKRLTWHRWEKGDPVDIARWEQFLAKTKKLRRSSGA